jgi:hypothetical protein
VINCIKLIFFFFFLIFKLRNKAGQTALQLAEQSNHQKIVLHLSSFVKISSLPIPDLLRVPVCGWLLSIFRAYSRHVHQFKPSGDDTYSVSLSCTHLNSHGLDGNMEELFEIVRASSIEEVMPYFGDMNFGNRVRVKSDLSYIVNRITSYFQLNQSTINSCNYDNYNYYITI